MTPAQCRAARGLLEITQSQLARAADLGLSTVVDFEKERRLVSLGAVEAIRAALERAGIEFIDENGGRGRGAAPKADKGWHAEKVVAHCMRNEANSNRPRIHRRLRGRIGVRLRRPKKERRVVSDSYLPRGS